MVKPYADLQEKMLGMTGFFETTNTYPICYGITSGNHDGAGLSHGVLQFNFGTGSLPPIWMHLINNYNQMCRDIFGTDYAEWEDVVMNRTTAEQVAWGDSISAPVGSEEKRGVATPWKGYFQTLGETQPSIDRQVIESNKWIPNADKWYKTLGLYSRRGYALCWDISVQMGRLFPLNQIWEDFKTIDPTGKTRAQIEEEKLYMIVDRCSYDNRVSTTNQKTVYDRKVMLVDGTGSYYGAPFNIEDFDLMYEPALEQDNIHDFRLGDSPIENVLLGQNDVDKIYLGPNLSWVREIPDTTAPTTTARPAGGTYEEAQTVWLEVDEACTTYYTIDGSTPTVNSPIFREELLIESNTTLKYFSVDKAGNTEAVKTSDFIINIPVAFEGYRYVRFVGHGDQTGATTRLVELQALEGTTNRLYQVLPYPDYPTPNGGTIGVATDGAKVHASGYPLWWLGEGIPVLTYDLGALYPIDTINVTGYSPNSDPRTTQFIIYVSTDNTNWTQVIDYSGNTTMQPEEGWYFTIPTP